jgi:hypothetical protein
VQKSAGLPDHKSNIDLSGNTKEDPTIGTKTTNMVVLPVLERNATHFKPSDETEALIYFKVTDSTATVESKLVSK